MMRKRPRICFLNTHNGQRQIRECVQSLWWNFPKIGSTGHEIATEAVWGRFNRLREPPRCFCLQESWVRWNIHYLSHQDSGSEKKTLNTLTLCYASTQRGSYQPELSGSRRWYVPLCRSVLWHAVWWSTRSECSTREEMVKVIFGVLSHCVLLCTRNTRVHA